jgi:hypothetical protein
MINHPVVLGWVDVTQLAVVDMKTYGHLSPANQLVGHAWIVRVKYESNLGETLYELAVVQ